jgi:hypothetical protein
MINRIINFGLSVLVHFFAFPFYLFILFYLFICKKLKSKNEIPKLIWGPDPLISNKYWSNALKEKGFCSKTLMRNVYSINKKNDYDLYFNDIVFFEKYFPSFLKFIPQNLTPFLILFFTLKNFDIVHFPIHGFCMGNTKLRKLEIHLFKLFGLKSIVLPYGGDFYEYSNVLDLSLRHVLLYNYPHAARNESLLAAKKKHLIKYADCIVCGFQTEGIGRWDVLPYQFVTLNEKVWKAKENYSNNDGKNGVVKISHSPNHRSIKATEFLVKAIEDLKLEGLNIELILIEKKPNDVVKDLLENIVDIHAEQFIATAYALSGIEGMACGLPVMANLNAEEFTRVFRRYSFLDECPILSATPETIKINLRLLITEPKLRKALGIAGRKYVEKYHSNNSAQFLFNNIYDKIWHSKDVDLMNLYHPLNKNSYNNQSALIKHPLIENKLPTNWQETINNFL